MKHTNDPVCTRCNYFLQEADTDLAYFVHAVRAEHPDAHISCAWRGEADQNDAYARGASKLKWPKSKHNKLDKNGNPCAEAVDFFRLVSGKALFQIGFYMTINHLLEELNAPILWGGDFKGKFKDYPHFELKG